MSKLRDIIIQFSEEKDQRTILYLNFSKCKFSGKGLKNDNKFKRFCKILRQTSAICSSSGAIFSSLKETAFRKNTGLNILIVRVWDRNIESEYYMELPRNSIFRIIFNKIKCQNQK